MEKSKLVLLIMCLLTCLSCSKVNGLQPSEDEGDQTELINNDSAADDIDDSTDNNIDTFSWFARLKLKPQADDNYLATEDPEIKALLLKYDVKITQNWQGLTSDPELLLYYDLTGKDNMSMESQEKCINDFLTTEKFEDEVILDTGETWSVRLILKPQADENYLATEDPEIKKLILKYGMAMRQTYPEPRSTPDLLLYYTLTGPSNMNRESRENCIADFLATGKFEDEVYEYKRGQWI